jgi:hypothetical protein
MKPIPVVVLICGTMALPLVALPRVLRAQVPDAAAQLGQASDAPNEATDDAALVASLNVRFQSVVSGATWCEGKQVKRMGKYRVVILSGGFEEIYHHLYVQLIEADAEAHTMHVVKTVPIKETLNPALVIQDIHLRPAGEALCTDAMIEATAVRRLVEGRRREKVRLRVTQKGEYTINFQPENRKKGGQASLRDGSP